MKRILLGKSKISALTRIACISTFIIFFVYPNFELLQVDGISMEPTLSHGDICVLNKKYFAYNEPSNGDVVVLIDQSGDRIIKRIIASPGDKFEIQNYIIYVNGKRLNDIYGKTDQFIHNSFDVLTKNEYIYFGDNRSESSWGLVDRKNILGKLMFVE